MWTGIPGPTISKFENGHRYPNLKNTIKLAGALRVSIDYLVGRDTTGAATFTASKEIPPPLVFTKGHALMLLELLKRGIWETNALAWAEQLKPPLIRLLATTISVPTMNRGAMC